MTIYYVSTAGNDSNSGTSTASPWRTVTRVNTAFSNGQLALGSQVLFQRGQTFYGRLRPPSGLNPASPGWCSIGAYGSGTRPIISGYKLLNRASGWALQQANVWRIDLAGSGAGVNYDGYNSAQGDGDPGFLRVDGTLFGSRQFSIAALTQNWQYYHSGTVLYVRATANPTTLAGDIRVALNGDGIQMYRATELVGVHLQGHGSHGVNGPGRGNTTRVRVLDCEIGQIGGAVLQGYGDGTTRYGNGMEFWAGTSDAYVEKCIIHDVYDTAYTTQGDAGGGYNAIIWRRNLIYRCSQGEEYWSPNSGFSYTGCKSEYNTMVFMGYGWGGDYRPYQGSRVFQLIFGTYSTSLQLRHNIYIDGRNAFCHNDSLGAGFDSDYNYIWLRPGTQMRWDGGTTISSAASWASGIGRETHSTFGILPSSSDVSISDADVAAALATCTLRAPSGQPVRGGVLPINYPWTAPFVPTSP